MALHLAQSTCKFWALELLSCRTGCVSAPQARKQTETWPLLLLDSWRRTGGGWQMR